ncbi:hypothetical protein AB0B99_20130 [Micromonospora haikouensis]
MTKHTGDCHKATTDRQRAHLDRLWRALRVTPCTAGHDAACVDLGAEADDV